MKKHRRKIQLAGAILMWMGTLFNGYRYFYRDGDWINILLVITFSLLGMLFYLQSKDIIKTAE